MPKDIGDLPHKDYARLIESEFRRVLGRVLDQGGSMRSDVRVDLMNVIYDAYMAKLEGAPRPITDALNEAMMREFGRERAEKEGGA